MREAGGGRREAGGGRREAGGANVGKFLARASLRTFLLSLSPPPRIPHPASRIHMPQFSYRRARSGSLLIGICIAILVETAALHLFLYSRSRIAAWVFTSLSVWAILWLVRSYQALGTGVISVDDEKVDLTIGRRYSMRVPRAIIADVSQPSFRDLPTPGTNEGRDFLNLLKPATPNVLIRLREPLRVRLAGGLHRTVIRLGLHLDNPSAFIDALQPIDHR